MGALSGHLKAMGYLIFASGQQGLPGEGLQLPLALSECVWGNDTPFPIGYIPSKARG